MNIIDLKTYYMEEKQFTPVKVLRSDEDLNKNFNTIYLFINSILRASSVFETDDKQIDVKLAPIKEITPSEESLNGNLYDSLKDIRINKINDLNYSKFDFKSEQNQPQLLLETSYNTAKTSILVSNNNISINGNIIINLLENKIIVTSFQGEATKIKVDTPSDLTADFDWIFGTNEALKNNDFKLNGLTLTGTLERIDFPNGVKMEPLSWTENWTGVSKKTNLLLNDYLDDDDSHKMLLKGNVINNENNFFEVLISDLNASLHHYSIDNDSPNFKINGVCSDTRQIYYAPIEQDASLFLLARNANGTILNHFNSITMTNEDQGEIICSSFTFSGNSTYTNIASNIKFTETSSDAKYLLFLKSGASEIFTNNTIYESNGTIYGTSGISLNGNASTTNKFNGTRTLSFTNSTYVYGSGYSTFAHSLGISTHVRYASQYHYINRKVTYSDPLTINYSSFIVLVNFQTATSIPSNPRKSCIFYGGIRETNNRCYIASKYELVSVVINASVYIDFVKKDDTHWYFTTTTSDYPNNPKQNVTIYDLILIPLTE